MVAGWASATWVGLGQSPPQRSTVYAGTFEQTVEFPAAAYAPNPSMTVEAWVYREDAGRCETLLSQDYTQSFWFGFCGGKLRFYRSGSLLADADANVPARRWTHVAASYAATGASGTVRFYIDGLPAGVKALANAGAGHKLRLYVASDPNKFLGNHYNFKGALDEVRVWSVARSEAEIRDGRFLELRGVAGLVAVFPEGGAREAVANLTAAAVAGASPQIAGILPRDLIVPLVVPAPVVDGWAPTWEYEVAEEMVLRYQDGANVVDTVARVVGYNPGGGPNCQIFLLLRGFRTATATLPGAHVALAWGPRSPERTVPSEQDYRLTGFFNDWSVHEERGNGIDGFRAGSAPPEASARFAICDGEFSPPCLEFGTGYVSRDQGGRMMLYHWRTNRVFVPPSSETTVFQYRYLSPFDADPNNPSTWAQVRFGSRTGAAATVQVAVRVVEPFPAEGTDRPQKQVPVMLYAGSTFLAQRETDTNGWARFSLAAPVGSPIRVQIDPPQWWRLLGVEAIAGTGQLPQTTTPGMAEFPACGEGLCDLSDLVFKVIAVPDQGIAVTDFSPAEVWPRVVLRESPLKVIDPTTLEIRGTNLHNALRVWLANCPGLPNPTDFNPWDRPGDGCGESDFHLQTNVQASADGTRLRVQLEVPLSLVGASRRLLIQDPVDRPFRVPWVYAPGTVRIVQPPYPQLWGFEFRNERDGTQFDEFSNVYQWRAYDCHTPLGPILPVETCPGCRVPNPVYLTFYSLVFTPWVELMTGSCLGYAVTSRLLERGDLRISAFQAGVHYPFGYPGFPPTPEDLERGDSRQRPPKPQQHEFRACNYSVPVNLWAHIHRHQAAQLSGEVIAEILSQLHGTGLGDSYSVDGAPNAVLSRLRGNMRSYVLSFWQSGDLIQAHVVAPYAITDGKGIGEDGFTPVEAPDSSLIHVYDPNWPGMERFVEVNRARNTYRYLFGFKREKPGDLSSPLLPDWWSGTMLLTLDVRKFQGPFSMPGADVLARGLALLIFGAADGLFTDRSGGRWGWDAAGKPHRSYTGYKAMPPFTQGIPPELIPPANQTRAVWFFPPTNSPPDQIAIHARGAQFTFIAGEGGTLFFLETRDAVAGDQDGVKLGRAGDRLGSLRYQPQRRRQDFTPTCGLMFADKPALVFAWEGLGLSAGKALEFRADREAAGVTLLNDDSQPVRPTLRLLRAAAEGVQTNRLGPFEVGPGAAHRLWLPDWPRTPTVVSALDQNRDGQAEHWLLFSPQAPAEDTPPRLSVAVEGAQLRLAWPVPGKPWVLERTESLSAPSWKPTPQLPMVSAGTAEAHLPLEGSAAFFRLRKVD